MFMTFLKKQQLTQGLNFTLKRRTNQSPGPGNELSEKIMIVESTLEPPKLQHFIFEQFYASVYTK